MSDAALETCAHPSEHTSPTTQNDDVRSHALRSLNNIRQGVAASTVQLSDVKTLTSVECEHDVGIEEFLQKTGDRFTGLLKYRWSDFVVCEIDRNGAVVELSSSDIPPDEDITSDHGSEQENSTGKQRPDCLSESLWQQLTQLNAGQLSDPDYVVKIPAGDFSKQDRTAVHMCVKKAFHSLISNTTNVDGNKCICVRKHSPRTKKAGTFGNHARWPRNRPRFLHFCLRKQSVDTYRALSALARALRMRPAQLSVAGTKDARADTHQMVSIKHVTAERLVRAATAPFCARLSVGNFSYQSTSLSLGELGGNRFSLTLRHVCREHSADSVRDLVDARMRHFERHGFINYFGLQRFGSGCQPTHAVGRAILRSQWAAAVDLILSSQLSSGHSVTADDTDTDSANRTDSQRMLSAQLIWRSERDAQRALAQLTRGQQLGSIEGRVFGTLNRLRTNACREALDSLPSGSRLLYVHAYQSWIWNRAVSRKLQRSHMPLPGDLVLRAPDSRGLDDRRGEDVMSVAEAQDENECCQAEPCEVLETLEGEEIKNGEEKEANGVKLPDVVVLRQEDVDKYSMQDVVIPLPGWAVRYPQNETAEDIRQMLAEDSVEFSGQMKVSMPQYNTAGAYRHVLGRPRDVRWRLVSYSEQDKDLLSPNPWLDDSQSGAHEVEAEAAYQALLLQFILPPSSYATMAVREITGSDSSLKSQLRLNELYRATFARSRHNIDKDKSLTRTASSNKTDNTQLMSVNDDGHICERQEIEKKDDQVSVQDSDSGGSKSKADIVHCSENKAAKM